MNKQTIIRYLKNELTSKETEELFQWIEASEDNRRYFNAVKNLWTASSLLQKPDVEQDFDDLKKRINKNVNTRSIFSRSINYLSKTAAILAIPLAIGVLWLLSDRKEISPLSQTDNTLISVYAPLCTRAEVILPDGTKVWLNSGSKISYPRLFEGKTREVKLEGEAYFDVAKNEDFPFMVKTPHNVDVKVKGTCFNLCAYEADTKAEVTLVSGAVDFIDETSGKKVSLQPLQSACYEKNNKGIDIKSNVNTELYTSWKDGILVFDNVSMLDLSKRLERWYGVNIIIKDTYILDYTYTGQFKEETIGQVLELIKQSSNIAYKMEDKQVFLFRKR